MSLTHTHSDEGYLPSQASFYPIIAQINGLFSDPVNAHYLQRWSGSAQLQGKLGP